MVETQAMLISNCSHTAVTSVLALTPCSFRMLEDDLADLQDLGGRVLIFVCGPEPLVSSASTFALNHGYDFHAETFEL